MHYMSRENGSQQTAVPKTTQLVIHLLSTATTDNFIIGISVWCTHTQTLTVNSSSTSLWFYNFASSFVSFTEKSDHYWTFFCFLFLYMILNYSLQCVILRMIRLYSNVLFSLGKD